MNPGILSRQGIQLADSVGRPVGGMDQGPDRVPALPGPESRLDLAEAANHLTGLGGNRQSLNRIAYQQDLGVGCERRRHADLALETPAELVTPHRCATA